VVSLLVGGDGVEDSLAFVVDAIEFLAGFLQALRIVLACE
jgi:hypothetical protein